MKAKAQHSGFTLTELLVAISLIVVLMLAVNVIFKTTADTISAGQALSAGMRDLRAVQSIIKRDLDGVAIADSPFFMIRSSVQPAFRNQKEKLADLDYSEAGTTPADAAARVTAVLSADPTGTAGAGPEPAQSVTEYGLRTFRTDMLGFFSKGLFQRQTGNFGTFVAPMTSNEAYIWYGHLNLPDNAAVPAYVGPGIGQGFDTTLTNPNNFYASQWMAGRQAMLLKEPDANYQVLDNNGVPQVYICRAWGELPANLPTTTSLSPFSVNSRNTLGGAANYVSNMTPAVQSSCYDLAGVSAATYRQWLTLAFTNGETNWWDYTHFGYRFRANPFPVRPLDSAKAAQTSPIFVPNCSQFIVEYAGDFTTQDPNGALSVAGGNAPDGITDFVVDPVTLLRRVRWYGMPRDILRTGVIQGTSALRGRDMLNVVPLQDVLATGGYPARAFEHSNFVPQNNYANPAYAVAAPGGGLPPNAEYICAWGPDTVGEPTPRMLRILIKPEDPNGKVDLPWQEMIFTLP